MKINFTYFALFFIIAFSTISNAQVGVGTTTPNASSILDLSSTSKGMLAPRMTEAQKDAITSPASGLLVYQTDANDGFWYYDGIAWIPFITDAGWTILGNEGTTDGTNFLGTTDDVAFNFKVNNVKAGRIGNSTEGNTTLGYMAGNSNTYNGSTFMGFNAGAENTSGTGNSSFGWSALYHNTTGFNNTGVGYASLKTATTGFDNSAFGMNALIALRTGGQNTAIGSNAGYSLTTGNGNTAVGQNSLYYDTTGVYNSALGVNSLRLCTTGGRNVGSGYNSLNGVTTGSYNTGLGYTAGTTITTGSNNTFIGSNADANSVALTNATAIGYSSIVGASNCLVLGGTGANLVKVGIGVSSPTNTLSFDGTAARSIWLERNTNSGTAGFSLTVQSGGAYSGGTNLNGGDLNISSGTSTGTGSSNIYFKVANAGASGSADNAPATQLTILGSGNVGVGTTTPNATLQVNGSFSLPSRLVAGGNATFSATDYSIINTGALGTYTLPSSPVSGRVIIITNHGTGSITTSAAYRTANGTTTSTVAVATSVQLIYDSTNSIWRKIN